MSVTLTVCLIVKNEEAVLTRALASVRDVADRWLIVDTGSTDTTRDVVEAFARANDWPGRLLERPWRDFGHNRNELLDLADQLPVGERTDWVLYIDADQVVVGAEHLRHEIAAADPDTVAYLVKTTGEPTYWTPRLVRTGEGRWRGRTHEVLCLPQAGGSRTTAAQPRSRATISHHVDGGARAGRLERDEALLREDLAEALAAVYPVPESGVDPSSGDVDPRPDEIRSRYYLGATLAALGLQETTAGRDGTAQYREAREHLEEVPARTSSEELAYVALRVAAWSHQQEGNDAEALAGYLVAARRRTGRYEAAFEAVRLLRRAGDEQRATVLGDRLLHRQPRTVDTFEVYPQARALLALEVAGAAITVNDRHTAATALGVVDPGQLDDRLAGVFKIRAAGLRSLLQPA